jgi:hypothetical protein
MVNLQYNRKFAVTLLLIFSGFEVGTELDIVAAKLL